MIPYILLFLFSISSFKLSFFKESLVYLTTTILVVRFLTSANSRLHVKVSKLRISTLGPGYAYLRGSGCGCLRYSLTHTDINKLFDRKCFILERFVNLDQ